MRAEASALGYDQSEHICSAAAANRRQQIAQIIHLAFDRRNVQVFHTRLDPSGRHVRIRTSREPDPPFFYAGEYDSTLGVGQAGRRLDYSSSQRLLVLAPPLNFQPPTLDDFDWLCTKLCWKVPKLLEMGVIYNHEAMQPILANSKETRYVYFASVATGDWMRTSPFVR